jgi:hypothetical protein
MQIAKRILPLLGLTLYLAPVAMSTTFTDGFEGSFLNPFWTVEPGPGTATLTNSAAYAGSQSLKLEVSPTFPWTTGVIHDFSSEQYGSVSVSAMSGPLCNCSAAALSIYDGTGQWIAVFQRTGDGSFALRFWPPGSPGEIPATPVSTPLAGWHQLEINSTAGGITAKFDGAVVFTNSAVAKFRYVDLQVWGGPAGSEYFDNFSVTTGASPLYGVCPLYDTSKAVKSGATLPVKLQLCNAGGDDQSSSAITVHAVSITRMSDSVSGDVEDSGNANPDNDFRFDSSLGSTGGYVFNLSTKGLTTGTYNLSFTVTGDTWNYSAPFQVK